MKQEWHGTGLPRTYRNFVCHQGVGVHDGHKLMQEVGLGHEELWSQFLHHVFQLLSSIAWDSIPGFWLAPGNKLWKKINSHHQYKKNLAIQFLIV